jgi:LacI family transcriptional regulator
MQLYIAMQTAGIIISISKETKDYRIFEKIRGRNIPVVYVNNIPEMDGNKTIHATDYQTALKATELAINLGYNNIAFTGFKSSYEINQEKFRKCESHTSKHFNRRY